MPSRKERLDGILAQHRQFLAQAQACIDKDIAEPDNKAQLAGLLSRLSTKLKAHSLWLDRAQADDAVNWGPITTARKSVRKGSSQLQLIVTGPAPGDVLTIKVDKKTDDIDRLEAHVQQLDKMSRALARAVEQEKAIFALHKAGASDDDGDADQARIVLLKRYNDVRDVAQQLIGIIAENNQVPVRSLYKDSRFGVDADD